MYKPEDCLEAVNDILPLYKKTVESGQKLIIVDIVIQNSAASLALLLNMKYHRYTLLDVTKAFVEKIGKFALCKGLQKIIIQFAKQEVGISIMMMIFLSL